MKTLRTLPTRPCDRRTLFSEAYRELRAEIAGENIPALIDRDYCVKNCPESLVRAERAAIYAATHR